MKKCNVCLEVKDITEYYVQKVIKKSGVKYYAQTPCISCRGVKGKRAEKRKKKLSTKNIDTSELTNEIRDYIRGVVRRNFYINDIDFFKIAHYHLLIFGFRTDDNCEIVSNWKEIYEWYLEDKPLEMTMCLDCDNIRPSAEMKSGVRCNQCASEKMQAYRKMKKGEREGEV